MKNIKKVGKIAAAALTGVTLIGSVAANLGDYPKPFIDEDGQVQSSIVVGQNAKTVDVVGAVNIAGSLGQDAYTTEAESVSGGSSFGWSTADGVTLDTSNDKLHFMDSIDSVRTTLTSQHLDALKDTTFTDDGGDKTDIEYYLYVGSQSTTFDQATEDEDPVVNLNVPSSVSQSSNLYRLEANFEDGLDFTSEDVRNEEITLFGKTYTVGSDSFDSENGIQLYGSSEEITVNNGESSTITIDGEEHTLEVVSVTNSNTTAVEVDGNLDEYDEDETFDINNQDVRVQSVIDTGDNGKGTVVFGIGSEEIVLEDGEQIQDGDGEDVDGTHVSLSGNDVSNGDISSVSVAVGAHDDDEDYLAAESSFEDPIFPVELQFGGMNPDAASDDGAAELEVSTSGDDTATVSFTSDSGDSQNVEFIYETSPSDSNEDFALADSDNNDIVAVEGDAVQEDEYFVSDAGDFSHMWQVNNIDTDSATSSSGDEATVDLQEVVGDSSVEVNLDAGEDVTGFSESGDKQYAGTEVIDGQTYHFVLDTAGTSNNDDDSLYVTWGTDADYDATGSGSSGVTTAFPSLKTENGGRLAFYDPEQEPTGVTTGASLSDFATSDNVYWNDQGTGSDVDSGDSIWIDNADDGEFNANGQIVGGSDPGTSLQEVVAPLLSIELDSPNSDPANNVKEIPSSGRLDNPKTSQEDIGLDSATTITEDQVVELADTGKYFILDSKTDAQRSSRVKLVGDDGDSTTGDNVKNKTLDHQQIDSQSQAGATGSDAKVAGQVTFSTTGADSLSIDDGGGSGVDLSNVAAGDVLALDENNDGDLTDASTVFVIADTAGADQDTGAVNSLSVIGPDGVTINDNSDVYTVSTSDSGTIADIDDEFLDSGSDIAASLNTQLSAATADYNYNGNNRIRIQSDDTSSDSYVEVYTTGFSGTDVSGAAYLDIQTNGNGVSSKRDQVQYGSPSDDSTTGSKIPSGSYLQYDGSGGFTDGDAIVEDNNDDSTYDSGDEVVGGGSAGNVQYWSSDADETNSVTSGLNSNLPSKPGLVFIEEEAEDDNQYSYILTASWDSTDDQVTIDSPTFSDSGKRKTDSLESNDDVTAGYDLFGSYTEYENNNQNSVTLKYPDGQATVGVAVTGSDGDISESGGSGSVDVNTPTGFPDAAKLDSDVSAESVGNVILVGGPAVNSLVSQLAEDGKTWTGSQYNESTGLVQLVEDAFSEGNSALVVAGYSGEDTRQAANYVANYASHAEELAGKMKVELDTE